MERISDDWHEEFFGGLWLDIQRQSFSEEDNRLIASVILDALQLPEDSRILDVPCADGRLALEFARRGHRVTGVERQPELLARAKEHAGREGLDVGWLSQDMWALDPGQSFDAAVCAWTSIGYGSRGQDQAFFDAVGSCLAEDGLFLFETHTYETLLADFEDRVLRWAGDVLVTEEREFDVEEGRLYTAWTFARDGSMERRRSAMQLYTVRELDAMLGHAGMKTVASWGSWDLDAFEVGSPILIGLARKTG